MYNSIFLNILSYIGSNIQKLYRHSLLNRTLTSFNRIFNKAYEESLFCAFSRSIKPIFKNSFVYRLVNLIIRFFDFVISFLFNKRKKLTESSELANSLDLYSIDVRYGLRLFYETFIILGFLLLAGKLFGYGLSIYFSIGMILLGLFGIFISGKEFQIIKSSIVLNFILDIFRLDKGGESWW